MPLRSRCSRQTGLTLVEMLVAMAITLIMMAAVVNLFANVGQSVQQRRASIEMASKLRTLRNLLQRDLAGATCPTLPWIRPEANVGYLEYVEGNLSDAFPSWLTDEAQPGPYELDTTVSVIPRAASAADPETLIPLPMEGGTLTLSGLGDYDDILALTVQRFDEPFVGRLYDPSTQTFTTIESNVAEVIWFCVENPARPIVDPVSGARISLGEPGMRTIFRRVLLIAPWVETGVPSFLNYRPGDGNGWNLQEFYRFNDVSVRIEAGRFIPNTLADLTKRENRFGHVRAGTSVDDMVRTFPHPMDVSALRAFSDAGDGTLLPTAPRLPLRPLGAPFEPGATFANAPTVEQLPLFDRRGEDVVITNVLGFDIRAFDPLAPLYDAGSNNPGGEIVGPIVRPGDAGWAKQFAAKGLDGDRIVARGAYVDLGYNRAIERWVPGAAQGPNAPIPYVLNRVPASVFSMAMHPMINNARLDLHKTPWYLNFGSVYDTWSFHFEHDGVNQDQDVLTDEGTDGIDDDRASGVDDMGERETSPPYATPLRGIQVTVRTQEPDSQTIRQISVKHSFAPR